MIEDNNRSNEFSRPLRLQELCDGTIERKIIAEPTELKNIEERFGCFELKSLSMSLEISHEPTGPHVKLVGSLSAELVQRCVITLEPIIERIEEPVEALYDPERSTRNGDTATNIEDDLLLEPLDGDVIDLGELAIQHLAVAYDPYPRKTGANFMDYKGSNVTPESDNTENKLSSMLQKWDNECR